MIELTEEMKAAVAKRMGGQLDLWMVPAIEDVLAIVERDYRLTCTAEIDHEYGTAYCVKAAAHPGGHRGELPSAGVFWS